MFCYSLLCYPVNVLFLGWHPPAINSYIRTTSLAWQRLCLASKSKYLLFIVTLSFKKLRSEVRLRELKSKQLLELICFVWILESLNLWKANGEIDRVKDKGDFSLSKDWSFVWEAFLLSLHLAQSSTNFNPFFPISNSSPEFHSV